MSTPVLTAIVRFRLPPGQTMEAALAEVARTVPLYQSAGPALIRKAIHLDIAAGTGTSVYHWSDRAAAEGFFAMAKKHIEAATGHAPEVELLDTHVYVDNASGTVTGV